MLKGLKNYYQVLDVFKIMHRKKRKRVEDLETINSEELRVFLEDLGIHDVGINEVIPLVLMISKDY